MLASHAAARHLPIASTTKLMTAYVAMQELPLDKIVRAAPYDPIYGESLLGLRTGQRISVRDLLYGLILRSGNDAAHDLALAAAGSVPRFVAQMNRRAAALGLADTHYANPVGLDQRGNYSSARDLATLTQRLLRIPAFAKIADSRSATLRSLRPPRRIATINELLLDAPWVTGVKTGHTFDAAYCLVGSGRRKGVDLISVALGAPSDEARFSDNLELLEYGFSQYRRRVPIQRRPGPRRPGDPLLRRRAAAAGRPHASRSACAAASGSASRSTPPPRSRGRFAAGPCSATPPSPSTADRPPRCRCAPAARFPAASAFDRVRAFVEDNPIPIAIAVFVILIGGVLLYRRLSGRNDQGERTRVKAK